MPQFARAFIFDWLTFQLAGIIFIVYSCVIYCHFELVTCVESRAVRIQSPHDTIRIAILASRYDTYHDIIFMHKSLRETLNTLRKQVKNRGSFLCNNACVRCLCLSYYRDQTCFLCINIRQVPWEMLKTEAGGRGFQHLPRDLASVNALKNHVRSLLLHKNWKHWLHSALFLALFCFAFSPMSNERNFHGLCSF